MTTRIVKAEDMKPGRKYTIEVPAGFAGNIDVSYDSPQWDYDARFYTSYGTEVNPPANQSVTIKFTKLDTSSGGITFTEHLPAFETGAVYRYPETGTLYIKQNRGWTVISGTAAETPRTGMFLFDNEMNPKVEYALVKLVPEK